MILRGIAFILALNTIAGFFGRHWWFFELLSYWRMLYFLLLAVIALVFTLARQIRIGVLFFVFALLNLMVIWPNFVKPVTNTPLSQTYRALLINVHESGDAYLPVQQLVQELDPDLILLSEANPAWIETMASWQKAYPFTVLAPRYAGAGIALYSRLPFKWAVTWNIIPVDRPALLAQIEIDDQMMTILGMHPHPPTNSQRTRLRNQQLSAAAEFASLQSGPVIVLGDLNITPWSSHFPDLLQTSGLRDSRRGFGPIPTWPVHWSFLGAPIDHFLASPDIIIHKFAVEDDIGSDHYPVYVDFSFAPQS